MAYTLMGIHQLAYTLMRIHHVGLYTHESTSYWLNQTALIMVKPL